MGFRYLPNAPGSHFDWVHGLFSLLVVAAIVAGVVVIARQWRRPLPPSVRPVAARPALHELDLRYARGEIERIDYLQRRADILGEPAAALPAPPAPPAPAS